MVRDWTFIRRLLEKIEAETLQSLLEDLATKAKMGDSRDNFDATVARHLELLIEAGLVKGIQVGSSTPGHVMYVRCEPRLTMAGYDLLEILRSQSFWNRIQERIGALGVGITLDAIKATALALLNDPS